MSATHVTVEAALRTQADATEKATGFMTDAELIEETLAEVALLRQAADTIERLDTALREMLNELGVPGEGYPAPVANAVEIGQAALGEASS